MTHDECLASLQATADLVNADLARRLDRLSGPDRLIAAMRHAIFAGGKRIRPFLVLESARLFDIPDADAMPVAAALECIHCYSLVHDDLPAMDDDDIRRGQPTVHRAYDEATAILVGDALLTLAFSILSDPRAGRISAGRRLRLIRDLATAAGVDGMVGGQMLDLAAEGRFEPRGRRRPSLSAIRSLQARKTGALIAYAVMAGAHIAPRSTPAQRRALSHYGRALGLAFQIKDDLLDIEGDSAVVGKAVAKDRDAGKATFVDLMGIEGARALLAETGNGARQALEQVFAAHTGALSALIEVNRLRNH